MWPYLGRPDFWKIAFFRLIPREVQFFNYKDSDPVQWEDQPRKPEGGHKATRGTEALNVVSPSWIVGIYLGSGTAALPLPSSQPLDFLAAFGLHLKSHMSLTHSMIGSKRVNEGLWSLSSAGSCQVSPLLQRYIPPSACPLALPMYPFSLPLTMLSESLSFCLLILASGALGLTMAFRSSSAILRRFWASS